jgi:hypothetical protein
LHLIDVEWHGGQLWMALIFVRWTFSKCVCRRKNL